MFKRRIFCCVCWAIPVLAPDFVEVAQPEVISQDEPQKRRIIYNDDGGVLKNMKEPSIEAYLSSRLSKLANTQVDTVFFCPHDNWDGVFYESNIEEVELRASPALKQLLRDGVDPIQETINFCHRNNMEIYCSFRMNDIHDSFSGNIGPFKRSHPELLLGSKQQNYPPRLPAKRTLQECTWSSLNFASKLVRDHVYRAMDEAMQRWDWDGLELDYGRNASLFMAVFKGHSATDQDRPILTTFQHRIRDLADTIARKRGKPCPIAVVVPETIEKARYVGIDIETWLEEGLVDIIIAGNGYVPFAPSSFEMASLGSKYKVPVHMRVNANTGGIERPYHKYLEVWRACATNAAATGGAGIYYFNTYDAERYYDHDLGLFNEIGNCDTLRFRDKLYLADWDFTKWHYGGGDVEFYMPRENLLPLSLEDKQKRVEFTCFEDLQEAIAQQKKPEVKLRLEVEGLEAGEEISFTINGLALSKPSSVIESDKCITYEYLVEPQQISYGTNTIKAKLVSNEGKATQAVVTAAQLWIRYFE